MRAIDTLMKRLGLVKLDKYGLVLTPEGRVMSMRPAVLDDGFGGKIVGWQDGDLAAAELQRWPAAMVPVAPRSVAPPPPLPQIARPIAPPVAALATVMPERVAPVVAAPVAPVVAAPAPAMPSAPVAVASAPPEEDDWEWTIAIARARTVAEDTEQALAPPPPAQRPAPVLAKPSVATQSPTTPRMARGTPAPFPTHAATTSPSTVIPVPALPSINNTARLAPVVRPSKPIQTVAPRAEFEDTVTAVSPAPPSEDTVPNLTLPVPARTAALPSIKRLGRA